MQLTRIIPLDLVYSFLTFSLFFFEGFFSRFFWGIFKPILVPTYLRTLCTESINQKIQIFSILYSDLECLKIVNLADFSKRIREASPRHKFSDFGCSLVPKLNGHICMPWLLLVQWWSLASGICTAALWSLCAWKWDISNWRNGCQDNKYVGGSVNIVRPVRVLWVETFYCQHIYFHFKTTSIWLEKS